MKIRIQHFYNGQPFKYWEYNIFKIAGFSTSLNFFKKYWFFLYPDTYLN